MRFWTIQSREVLDIINNQGVYHPKFSMSRYYKKYGKLYDFMLTSFNDINGVACDGLIFAFCVSKKDMIYPIQSIEHFYHFINLNKDKIEYLWNYFIENDSYILELDLDLTFNDLALSFNDFQYIMPSRWNKLIYDPEEYETNCEQILSNIKKGCIMSSGDDFDLIQSHLPYIKQSDIKNIYTMFDLNDDNV